MASSSGLSIVSRPFLVARGSDTEALLSESCYDIPAQTPAEIAETSLIYHRRSQVDMTPSTSSNTEEYTGRDDPGDYLTVVAETQENTSASSSSAYSGSTTEPKRPLVDYVSAASTWSYDYNGSITEPKTPFGDTISERSLESNCDSSSISENHVCDPLLDEETTPSEITSPGALFNPLTIEMTDVLIHTYTEENRKQISIKVPALSESSSASEIPETKRLCDPKIVLSEAVRGCDILPLFIPMFGLWDSASRQWIMLSKHMEANRGHVELRVRYSFNTVDGQQHACRVQKVVIRQEGNRDGKQKLVSDDEECPMLSSRMVIYLFYQRRHDFLENFPQKRNSNGFMKYLLPEAGTTEPDLQGDGVLIAALFDLVRKEFEARHRIAVSDPIKLLPFSSQESLKSERLLDKLKEMLKWGVRHVVTQRFYWIVKSFAGIIENKPMEYYCQKYIAHVESLEPLLTTEMFHLADDVGIVSANGDGGVIIVVDESKLRDVLILKNPEEGDIGVKVESSNSVSRIHVDFLHIADMTLMPQLRNEISLSDIVGSRMVLRFSNDKEAASFHECVNGYRSLLGGLPIAKGKQKLVHGPVTKRFLHQKLASHPIARACAYAESSTTVGDYILMIKYPGEDGRPTFRCSSIERVPGGYKIHVDAPELILQASSIDDFISKMKSNMKSEFGKDIFDALNNVIRPRTTDISTLRVRRASDCTNAEPEEPMIAVIPEIHIAHVERAPELGRFTRTALRRYSGPIDSHKFSDGKKLVFLVTIEVPERGKQQSYSEEFQKCMTMLFHVRQHCHVIRHLGRTNDTTFKVLEYSEWGNLPEYFRERRRRGKRGDNDQGAITGYWLLHIFYQLAHVLNYLEFKNLPHGYICAENIILSRVSPTPFAKLTHLGLTEESRHQKKDRTIDYDKKCFATTLCEIEHIATFGESFREPLFANRYHNKTRTPEREVELKVPSWLKMRHRESGIQIDDDFEQMFQRCKSENPSERPSSCKMLECLAKMLHHEVGKEELKQNEPEMNPGDYNVPPIAEMPTTFMDSELREEKLLGVGHYGTVYLCSSKGKKYAVKEMEFRHRTSTALLYREFNSMLRVKHENVVQIKGITTSDRIVMEYYELGSLYSIIMPKKTKTRRNETKRDPPFPAADKRVLLGLAVDIAMGLEAIHRCNILHRDLALRNILVKRKNDRYIAAISDFGLSVISKEGVYKDYLATAFPEMWYPPECFDDEDNKRRHLPFSFESDIWSYGITIWEMFAAKDPPLSLGKDASKRARDKFAAQRESTLEQPVKCPPKIYQNVLKQCWKYERSDRIKIPDIIKRLQEEIYLPEIRFPTENRNMEYDSAKMPPSISIAKI